MSDQSFLRELADNWLVVTMTAAFLGTIVWAFRPGSRDLHRNISEIPFRHEDAPASEASGRADPNLYDEELSK